MSPLLRYGTPTTTVRTKVTHRISIGLIDALELFAGLITFADSKAEDKLRCKLVKLCYLYSRIRSVRLQRDLKSQLYGPGVCDTVCDHLNQQNLQHWGGPQ